MPSHDRNGRALRDTLISLLAASAGALSCQGLPDASGVPLASRGSARSPAGNEPRAVPRPIPGGDYFPDLPHHHAGIIHQFYPGPVGTPFGFDGVWAEPNEITDFDGTVAQVYMGGTATDSKGNRYIVDVDNRVYQGEFIAANGERAHGTFCEI